MTIGIHAELDAYRIASAELPLRTRSTGDLPGAIAVVPGSGAWWEAVVEAAARGAAAVVVDDPGAASTTVLDELSDRVDVPVVTARPLFRADLVAALTSALADEQEPSAVVVECRAAATALHSALRDALGWARVLARAPLAYRSGERGIALLETDAGLPVSVVVAGAAATTRGRIRVSALGPARAEVDGDERGADVSVTGAGGRHVLATRFETPERLALRRAVDAAVSRTRSSDLADLRLDALLAEMVTGAQDASRRASRRQD